MDETALLGLLEAIYALDLDDQSWLSRVLAAARGLWGPTYTYLGYFYDASEVADFKVWNVSSLEMPPEVRESLPLWRQAASGPGLVDSTLKRLRVVSARRTGSPYMEPVLAHRERVGWGDLFTVNGLDPSGVGCTLNLGTREREFRASPAEMETFTRVAHHLSAAFRCRRRLGVSTLPDDAWPPIPGARWTPVKSFEEDGTRYVVVRENQVRAGLNRLTDRERQVVMLAALGSTSKEIAHTLGISDSTVRVLIARAANRIGARSRAELFAHPSLEGMRPARASRRDEFEASGPPSSRSAD